MALTIFCSVISVHPDGGKRQRHIQVLTKGWNETEPIASESAHLSDSVDDQYLLVQISSKLDMKFDSQAGLYPIEP
jgi:hypothetical protein